MFFVAVRKRDGSQGRLPIDVDPVEVQDLNDRTQLRGKFVFIEDEMVRAAVPGDAGPFFASHHSTCPNAGDFRTQRQK